MKRVLFSLLFVSALFAGQAFGQVGKSVSPLQLIDANDKPKAIPSIGKKVIMIFYTDPDVKDVNDPLSEVVKAKGYPKDKYQAIGVANCKDTWIPNSGIRMKARQKEKQFPESLILLDENHTLAQAWGLGDCNGAGVVVIIGKDSKVKFVRNIKNAAESKAAISSVLKILDEEIAK
ncbi:MAG: YtfJ family protein [Bacteroidota bacterium]|nr:YtfJ family protein [Bacteroidota bacterium]